MSEFVEHKKPSMISELLPYEDEVNAALKNKDYAAFRKIVEKAGLTWHDAEPSEKYMFDDESRL